MHQRVGTCSLCGGDVYGYRGAWYAFIPPPPDKCSQCGAVRAEDVIEMRRIGHQSFLRFDSRGYGNVDAIGTQYIIPQSNTSSALWCWKSGEEFQSSSFQ